VDVTITYTIVSSTLTIANLEPTITLSSQKFPYMMSATSAASNIVPAVVSVRQGFSVAFINV
jgi:hypothetical protein